MGFTDLILGKSSRKSIFPSQYDKKIVVATTKKIIKALNPTHNGKLMCNVIGSILENYNCARLHNYAITSILKFINSTFTICNLNLQRTDVCNFNCIPSDFSNIDSTKMSLSNFAFLYFVFLFVA